MQFCNSNALLYCGLSLLLISLIFGNADFKSVGKSYNNRGSIEFQHTSDPPNVPEHGVLQESFQPTDSDEKERIERLSKYLTGTRWTGQFTVVGNDAKPPAPEQYEILEANKADEGDNWNLVVRIKYGKNDVTLPLPPLEIKWAGETPVITVDRLTIPTMGTFDARVLIRRGQYAGTWAHDDVGGHLFGTIEKMESDGESDDADKAMGVSTNSP